MPEAVELLRAPKGGTFDTPVWVPSMRRLIVVYTPPGGDPTPAWRNHLFSLRLDGSGLAKLPLPARAGCRATSHDIPRLVADGRVSYLEECWGEQTPKRAKRLRAYDPKTQKVENVLPYSLPVPSNYYAFDPAAERLIINDGRGLFEGLRWLTKKGQQKLAVPFQRAGHPSWSPDGRFIAVDAVPGGETAEGTDRLDLARSLYLLRPDGRLHKELLSDLESVGASSWSPDSRWLAMPIDPEGGPPGFYLLDTRSGTLRLLLEGRQFGGSVWLPDGRTLLVATGIFAQIDEQAGPVGVYRIRLPRLVP